MTRLLALAVLERKHAEAIAAGRRYARAARRQFELARQELRR